MVVDGIWKVVCVMTAVLPVLEVVEPTVAVVDPGTVETGVEAIVEPAVLAAELPLEAIELPTDPLEPVVPVGSVPGVDAEAVGVDGLLPPVERMSSITHERINAIRSTPRSG